MKSPATASSPVFLALTLVLCATAPAFAGGKASDKHVQAREAKAEADAVAEKKAQAKVEAEKAGVKAPEEEKGWVWNHRRVRHKQTMPAAPTLSDTDSK